MTTTVYLCPAVRPDLMADYVRLTGFTEEEILEICKKAGANNRLPMFEIDADEDTLDELKSLYCEIPWMYKDEDKRYTHQIGVVPEG